jgi:hypothetical protein
MQIIDVGLLRFDVVADLCVHTCVSEKHNTVIYRAEQKYRNLHNRENVISYILHKTFLELALYVLTVRQNKSIFKLFERR